MTRQVWGEPVARPMSGAPLAPPGPVADQARPISVVATRASCLKVVLLAVVLGALAVVIFRYHDTGEDTLGRRGNVFAHSKTLQWVAVGVVAIAAVRVMVSALTMLLRLRPLLEVDGAKVRAQTIWGRRTVRLNQATRFEARKAVTGHYLLIRFRWFGVRVHFSPTDATWDQLAGRLRAIARLIYVPRDPVHG